MFRPSLYYFSYLANCCGCGCCCCSSCCCGCACSIEAALAFCLANWPEEEVFCDCAVACSCKISITLEKKCNFQKDCKKVLVWLAEYMVCIVHQKVINFGFKHKYMN